jgi:hypothetical protein
MEGDFTRNSDDPSRSYSGVLMQQGRVQLDADWNEQWAIQTRALRLALADLIGAHGGPSGRVGFKLGVKPGEKQLTIASGPYYVDGIRCAASMVDGVIDLTELKLDGSYLALLEVWDRLVSPSEEPEMREVALRGVDTAARAQTVWSLRLQALAGAPADLDKNDKIDPSDVAKQVQDELDRLQLRPRPCLRVRGKRQEHPQPCARSPEARYLGPENQLYRVEIHRPPAAAPQGSVTAASAPLFYFKWSRENGSVVFPIDDNRGPELEPPNETTQLAVKLSSLGRDSRFGLVPGDIVEFVDRTISVPRLNAIKAHDYDDGSSGALAIVREVDPERERVIVEVQGGNKVQLADQEYAPCLRRWDQRPASKREGKDGVALSLGAIPVYAQDIDKRWFALEHGIEVQFAAPPKPEPADDKSAATAALAPRAGDYWSFPARTALADVQWPKNNHEPLAIAPHGVERHYAPLAIVQCTGDVVTIVCDLRKEIAPAATTSIT